MWHPVFAEGIKLLSWKYFSEKYLTIIKKMVNLSHTPTTRLASAHILGATLNIAADQGQLNKAMITEYCDLCQDVDLSVRFTMLDNMPILLVKIKQDIERDLLTQEILNNIKDQNIEICLRAYNIIVTKYQYFNTDKLKSEFLPELLKEIDAQPSVAPPTNSILSFLKSHFAEILEMLVKSNLSTLEINKSLNLFFRNNIWIKQTEQECIKISILSLPFLATMNFSKNIDDFPYESEFQERLKNNEFIMNFAKNFHNLQSAYNDYGKESRLKQSFNIMLWNENLKYVRSFMSNLVNILTKFLHIKKESDEENSSSEEENVPEKYEESKEDDFEFKQKILTRIKEIWKLSKTWPWREQENFIQILSELQDIYSIEEFNNYFLDELLMVSKTGNRKTKSTALKVICEFLTRNHYSKKRTEIFNKLIDFSKSTSYIDRHHYLVFIETAIEYFSFSLLNSYKLFERYLYLTEDRITNIKLKCISVAISLWKSADEPTRDEIQDKLNNLRNDKNKDVRNHAEITYTQLQSKAPEYRKNDYLNIEHNKLHEEAEKCLIIKEEEEDNDKKQRKLSDQITNKCPPSIKDLYKMGNIDIIKKRSLKNDTFQKKLTGPKAATPQLIGVKTNHRPRKPIGATPAPPPTSGKVDHPKRTSAPDVGLPQTGQSKRRISGGVDKSSSYANPKSTPKKGK